MARRIIDTTRGRPTVYGPKSSRARALSLTPLAERILEAAGKRTGGGRSNVVEHLIRLYGGTVTADELAPVDDEARA